MTIQLQSTASRPTLVDNADGRLATRQLITLVLCGAGASLAVAFIELHLRVPGNAILRAVIPMGAGLVLVPRRMSGMTMSGAACLTTLGLKFSGLDDPGLPSFTSLTLLGPMLDLARFQALSTRWLYVRFALAGVATNLAACCVRALTTWLEVNPTRTRPFAQSWIFPLTTYTLCGALAGLLAATVWYFAHRTPKHNRVQS